MDVSFILSCFLLHFLSLKVLYCYYCWCLCDSIPVKHIQQDWYKVLSVFSCRGDFLLGYQDTECLEVCVCHAVFLTFLCSCARDFFVAWFENTTHTQPSPSGPAGSSSPAGTRLEWHNLHRCPLVSPLCRCFHTVSLRSFKSQSDTMKAARRLFPLAVQLLWALFLSMDFPFCFPVISYAFFFTCFYVLNLQASETAVISQINPLTVKQQLFLNVFIYFSSHVVTF